MGEGKRESNASLYLSLPTWQKGSGIVLLAFLLMREIRGKKREKNSKYSGFSLPQHPLPSPPVLLDILPSVVGVGGMGRGPPF